MLAPLHYAALNVRKRGEDEEAGKEEKRDRERKQREGQRKGKRRNREGDKEWRCLGAPDGLSGSFRDRQDSHRERVRQTSCFLLVNSRSVNVSARDDWDRTPLHWAGDDRGEVVQRE